MHLSLPDHARALATETLTKTVPKNRRPKFDVHLHIHDLNNVPLVSGSSFCKYHLSASTSPEHRGRTPSAPIKDHKVVWAYDRHFPVRLTIDKNGHLQECWLVFEVVQEYAGGSGGGGKAERITLGLVKLNLAEYVIGDSEVSDGVHSPTAPGVAASTTAGTAGVAPTVSASAPENEAHAVTRRYLMQDSKINSTLKLTIALTQLDGDRHFIAPPLQTAPVFTGIAGILSSATTEPPVATATSDHPTTSASAAATSAFEPSALSAARRETSELQDMYRRTLAAHWAAQPGELKADACIEDIFAGGDGWGSRLVDPNKHRHHPSAGSVASSHRLAPAAAGERPETLLIGEGPGLTLAGGIGSGSSIRGVSAHSSSGGAHLTVTSEDDDRSRHRLHHHRRGGSSSSGVGGGSGGVSGVSKDTPHRHGAVRGRGSMEGSVLGVKEGGGGGRRGVGVGGVGGVGGGVGGWAATRELREEDLREDLRSWRCPAVGL